LPSNGIAEGDDDPLLSHQEQCTIRARRFPGTLGDDQMETMDVVDEPVELTEEDLELVAGGCQSFSFDINFNNVSPNEGVQIFTLENGVVTFP
jgi:hypothetical protein